MRSTEKPAVWYVSLPSKGIQMKCKHGAKRPPHTGPVKCSHSAVGRRVRCRFSGGLS